MANNTKKKYGKILTPEFRVSFPAVFQARKVNEADPNEKAKFSIQMLFQVKETEKSKAEGRAVVDIGPLKAAVSVVLLDNLGADWQKKILQTKADGAKMYKLPFRDGAALEKKDRDGYGEGIVFCNASSLMKTGVVNAQNQDIIDPNEFYGGCYARATIVPHWYSVLGNNGVSFWLENVQKIRDGVPFSGRTKAEDDFDAIEQPSGAVPAGAGATGDPFGL